ncbi:hypothetical protein PR048_017092 [Dryococelus australis]|uniref:Uncharacterized protein n=1 Tax=Dryococelus australis TaxID=614101 RepID=A0ABQ9H8I7_9NEOP|nr:hypothetical protein PR048_017092 [Dryococelus australis]
MDRWSDESTQRWSDGAMELVVYASQVMGHGSRGLPFWLTEFPSDICGLYITGYLRTSFAGISFDEAPPDWSCSDRYLERDSPWFETCRNSLGLESCASVVFTLQSHSQVNSFNTWCRLVEEGEGQCHADTVAPPLHAATSYTSHELRRCSDARLSLHPSGKNSRPAGEETKVAEDGIGIWDAVAKCNKGTRTERAHLERTRNCNTLPTRAVAASDMNKFRGTHESQAEIPCLRAIVMTLFHLGTWCNAEIQSTSRLEGKNTGPFPPKYWGKNYGGRNTICWSILGRRRLEVVRPELDSSVSLNIEAFYKLLRLLANCSCGSQRRFASVASLALDFNAMKKQHQKRARKYVDPKKYREYVWAYSIVINGKIMQVSIKIIRNIQKKVLENFSFVERRGLHANRPHKLCDNVTNLMGEHLEKPHYSAHKTNLKYFENTNLTIKDLHEIIVDY